MIYFHFAICVSVLDSTLLRMKGGKKAHYTTFLL